MTSAETATELRFDPPGPGSWEIDAVHFPRPATRYWTEMHPEPFTRGFQEFTRYYGMLFNGLAYSYINGFAYSDLPQTVNDSYQILLMLSQSAVGAGEFAGGVKAPPMVLPPLSKFRQHLSPAAQFFWSDDAGWHAKSSSPFPCADMLGSPAGAIMALPLGAAVIMPAYARQRAPAQRVQVDNNLQMIGAAPRTLGRCSPRRNCASTPSSPPTPARKFPPTSAPASSMNKPPGSTPAPTSSIWALISNPTPAPAASWFTSAPTAAPA